MLEDIGRVDAFTRGLDRASFARDERAVFAVAYAFIRLGEAVGTIPPLIKEAHPEVEWGEIRHFRNFMIHVYHAVDPGRLYDTAVTDLPPLAKLLAGVLAASTSTCDREPIDEADEDE